MNKPISMRLSEIISESELKLIRDGAFEALGLLDSPVTSSILTFVSDARFIKQFGENVSCVICSPDVVPEIPAHVGVATSLNPKMAFFELHNRLSTAAPLARAQFSTVVGYNCSIHNLACIAETNVRIGNNVVIEEFVSIKENTVIGNNVIIRAGTIIGGEGYYFIRVSEDTTMPVQHFGGVIIEDDVEIQQGCAFDRAYFPWDDTVIGQGSKIDNLVHAAHAVKIGKSVFITSCVSIAGNVRIGDNMYIGPGSTFSNNITAGDDSRVSLGSVVVRNIAEESTVTGNFAIEHSIFMNELKERFKKHS